MSLTKCIAVSLAIVLSACASDGGGSPAGVAGTGGTGWGAPGTGGGIGAGTGGSASVAGTGGSTPVTGTGGSAPAASAGAVVDEWTYSGASYPRADGTTAELVISGELSLRANGTWEHRRRVGSVTASGRGTYSATATRLTLVHDDGSQNLAYNYFVGTHTDASGVQFKALTLELTDGFKYLLVESK
jgi:hypothetical protein